MLDVIKGFTEQVTEYSTLFGQIWYLCVFLFRGMVVVTIGGDVYSDEQSEFKCSTDVVGCENICFANFSKISHIRFWAFQLLAVSTPTILFHFFVIGVKTRIEKMKALAKESFDNDCDNSDLQDSAFAMQKSNSMNRKNKRGPKRVHFKSVYDANSNDLKEVAFTDSIYAAYFVNVLFRAVIEGLFLYLSYDLFKFLDVGNEPFGYGALDFIWFHVPVLYRCQGRDVASSCHQHVDYGKGGYVPCWVSRPWEKTIFLRYMNILSCLCFLLSVFEFVYLIARGTRTAGRRRSKKRNSEYLSWPSYSTESKFSSTLAVPIKLSIIEEFEQQKGASNESSNEDEGEVKHLEFV